MNELNDVKTIDKHKHPISLVFCCFFCVFQLLSVYRPILEWKFQHKQKPKRKHIARMGGVFIQFIEAARTNLGNWLKQVQVFLQPILRFKRIKREKQQRTYKWTKQQQQKKHTHNEVKQSKSERRKKRRNNTFLKRIKRGSWILRRFTESD